MIVLGFIIFLNFLKGGSFVPAIDSGEYISDFIIEVCIFLFDFLMAFIEEYFCSVFIFEDFEIFPGLDPDVFGLDFWNLGLFPLLITFIFIL